MSSTDLTILIKVTPKLQPLANVASDIPPNDPILSQFRISPDQMPKMSTPTMAPNYTSIRKFQLTLEKNALSVQSHQSELGYLALVIKPEDYLTANNNQAFTEATDPGLIPPDPTVGISTRTSAANDVAVLPYCRGHHANFQFQATGILSLQGYESRPPKPNPDLD